MRILLGANIWIRMALTSRKGFIFGAFAQISAMMVIDTKPLVLRIRSYDLILIDLIFYECYSYYYYCFSHYCFYLGLVFYLFLTILLFTLVLRSWQLRVWAHVALYLLGWAWQLKTSTVPLFMIFNVFSIDTIHY